MHGYRFGLRQPVAPFDIVFRLPAAFDVARTLAWMTDALEFDSSRLPSLLLRPASLGQEPEPPEIDRKTFIETENVSQASLDYLQCLLGATMVLLQDIRAPVFERPVISGLKVEPTEPSKFRATVWLGNVEAVSHDITQRCVVMANHLLTAVCEHHDGSAAMERIVQEMHAKQLKPLLDDMPGGMSSISVLQAAFDRRIPFVHVGAGCYLLGWGSRSRLLDRSSNSMDSAIGAGLSHRKDVAVYLMRQAGIPVPRGFSMMKGQPVPAGVQKLHRPLVVKPVDRDRGEGVTMDIQSDQDLLVAIREVSRITAGLLIEEQIPGVCHRILVVEGKVVWAVKRNPRGVIGDGVKTVRQLVAERNADNRKKIPVKRTPELEMDDVAVRCLSEIGIGPDTVPKAGRRVELRPVQTTAWGGDPELVTSKLHPDNAALAIRVAALFHLSSAGVDFISTNIAEPWHANGAVINEVNYAPLIGRTYEYMRAGADDYVKLLFPDSPIVPIEVFVGSDLSSAAKQRHAEMLAAGDRAFLCTETSVIDHQSEVQPLFEPGNLFQKIRMLQLHPSVDALIVHIDRDNSFLKSGLPFPSVSRLVRPGAETRLSADQHGVIAQLLESLPPDAAIECI